MQQLHEFDPVFAGSVPINIDIETSDIETSDIDIICYCKDHESFSSEIEKMFGAYDDFRIID